MANPNAQIPLAIRIIDRKEEELGRQLIKLALMDPSELRNSDNSAFTIAEFRQKFPVFDNLLDFSDFAGEEDNHKMVFNQGSATEHHFTLPSLNKLVPMIEDFLEASLHDYINAKEMRTDIDEKKPFPTKPVSSAGSNYGLAEFYEMAFLPPGAAPLRTDSPEFFHMVAADYAHKGCRG